MSGDGVSPAALQAALIAQGYGRTTAPETFALLGEPAGWAEFAASWNDLPLDGFMADGGRYRKRRFAAFSAAPGRLARKPHQPHYQSRDYNALNGGVQRWFEPVSPAIADHPVLRALIARGVDLFHPINPDAPAAWHVEVHQFRIEARAGQAAGVDWVIVMLVDRVNVRSGVTDIYAPDGRSLGAFTLAAPGEAVFLDDLRVLHGVTAIQPEAPAAPAVRDVLVVTFRHDLAA
jgi:hypothetical protein